MRFYLDKVPALKIARKILKNIFTLQVYFPKMFLLIEEYEISNGNFSNFLYHNSVWDYFNIFAGQNITNVL